MAGVDEKRMAVTRQLLLEIWRWAQIAIGWLLILLAPPIGGLLPGPMGFVGFALGLVLVLRNSRWARRKFVQVQRRYPVVGGWIRRKLLRRRNGNGDGKPAKS